MITDKLGNHVEILSGFAFKSNRFNDDGKGLPLVRIRDVKPRKSETFYDGEFEERYVLSDGDMLVGMDGEFNCARWNGGPALLNQRVCRIRATSAKLDEQYLFWFLPKVLKEIEEVSNFVTVKHLSSKQINEIEIPLPPMEEQKRIAAILDQADDIRRKRQHAIDRLNQLPQVLYIEMFGDVLRGTHKHNLCSIEELCSVITDCLHTTPAHFNEPNSFPSIRSSELQGGFIDLANAKYVSQDEYVQRIQRHKPVRGDIIYCREGARYGNVGLVLDGMTPCLGQRTMLFQANEAVALSNYLWATLCSENIFQQAVNAAGGAASPHVNIKDIRKFKSTMPPIREQKIFSDMVDNIITKRGLFAEQCAKFESLFSSLQHRAFAGGLCR